MSTSKPDFDLKSLTSEIGDTFRAAVSDVSADYIFNTAIEFRRRVLSESKDFFRFIADFINGGREDSPFKDEGIYWTPLLEDTRAEKARYFRKFGRKNDADENLNYFYSYRGNLERSLRSSSFSMKEFFPYFVMTLHIVRTTSDGRHDNATDMHQADVRIKSRINKLLKDATDVSFYFVFGTKLTSRTWKMILNQLSDKMAYEKFFETGRTNLPNENSRSLLRPALNRYFRKYMAPILEDMKTLEV